MLKRISEWRKEKIVYKISRKYRKNAPAFPSELNVPKFFPYIHFKAYLYLSLGPVRHRNINFYQLPPKDLTQDRLDIIKNGCEQILNWRGISPDFPLEDIGIECFYDIFQMFRFKIVKQSAFNVEDDFFLDEMHLEHVLNSRSVTIYNKVKKISSLGYSDNE